MLKNSYIFILIITLFSMNGCNKMDNKIDIKDNNSTKLAIVNKHTITTKVLGKKEKIFYALSDDMKKKVINKLIDDEILIQYVLDKNKSLYQIKDENKRAKLGLLLLSKDFIEFNSNSDLNDTYLLSIYEKNKNKYWHDDLIELSHIIVKTENEANQIIQTFNNSSDINQTFRKICKEKSLNKKTSANGGYLGFLSIKVIPKSYQKALDKLVPNKYTSKPIKTKYGYAILYLHSKIKKGYFDFDKIKKSILLQENKIKMNKWALEKIKKLKRDTEIIYLYKK